MKLHYKKILSYQYILVIASIFPILIFGFLTYNDSQEQSAEATLEHIENINKLKKNIVLDYFEHTKFNVNTLGKTILFLQKQAKQNIINIQNLQKNHLENYYDSIEKEIIALSKKDIFQYIYSFKNRGKDVDEEYLKNIFTYKQELGIKNVLMINEKGKILYSSDQTNLINTNVKNLTHAFNKTWNELKSKKSVYFVEMGYEKLSESYKQYAITQFKDVKGYIAIEINQDAIQRIIGDVASLGSSAETYLTYRDESGTFLATNRHIKYGKIGDIKTNKYIDAGFNSKGVDIKYSSLNNIEMVGYMPVVAKNLLLSMQTTVSYTDIISPTVKGTDYFEQFISDHNYNNIMLIGYKGDIFYSVKKEDDYLSNVLTGKYSNTHLSEAVQKVIKTKKFLLTDIDLYKPNPNGIAQFALYPIMDKNAVIQTIVVVELDIQSLTDALSLSSDIYTTNETYIIGDDYKLRTDTLLEPKKYNVLNSFNNNITISTKAVKDSFLGNSSTLLTKDYRGVDVLSTVSTINNQSFQWAVLTEIDSSEIISLTSGLKTNILAFVFISSIMALIAMIGITNEKNKHDKKISFQATHDNLTGLPNRKFATDFLAYMLANSKRFESKGAVLFIDLDKFKIINDTFGHEAGDVVLKEISVRLKKVLRDDDLIARLGGDEFLLISSNFSSINDIDALCKRIIKTVSEPIKDKTRNYEVGASIGISIFPDDSVDPEELLNFSDIAMYRTKENGRNDFTYYDKKMSEASFRISRVERELKHAIENDELVLHFQPQIDLKTSKVIGAEALVRWNHPKDGLIMPNDFIPIAEGSNLIIDLGLWVLKEACSKFKTWKKNDNCTIERISVNMSAKQLQCRRCVENIQKILDDVDFKAQWLELEITENSLISNYETTISNIQKLKEMGIIFSIDDFGTGYSSLSYLKKLDLSTLKIDREFVKDMIHDEDSKSIVEAIILMANKLHYTIIAEGAEKQVDIEMLRSLSCDVIQGFYYSKPLAEKDLLEYLDIMSKNK
ncbi:bifunctional diguanylate cyclase/phosphodiesterase [Sulfurimonas sp.]